MTNIMALVRNNPSVEEGLFPLVIPGLNGPIGVVVSDGLVSNGFEVTPGYQKVFPCGKNYLLGTGAGDHIQFVARELEHEDISPEVLAYKAIETIDRYVKLESSQSLNFIVAGFNGDNIELYQVAGARLRKPIKAETFLTDGSGRYFVEKAIERDQQRNLFGGGAQASIADLTAVLYDLSHVARKSAGVNEQVQYGFMLKEGMAYLAHPHIDLSQPTKEYLTNGKFDREKVSANTKFYHELSDALWDFMGLQNNANRGTVALHFSTDADERKRIHEFLDLRTEQLQKLRVKLNRMIVDYVRKHNPK